MEANPGTIDINNFKDYAKVGINRISLGIQSFNDKHLKKLEREFIAQMRQNTQLISYKNISQI